MLLNDDEFAAMVASQPSMLVAARVAGIGYDTARRHAKRLGARPGTALPPKRDIHDAERPDPSMPEPSPADRWPAWAWFGVSPEVREVLRARADSQRADGSP